MRLLAFDPGNTTGWVELNEKAELQNAGNAEGFEGLQKVLDLYDDQKVDRVVIEEYFVFPGKAMMLTGTKLVTSQTEGIIKGWCLRKKIPFTTYRSSLCEVQQKHSQIKPTGPHKYSHYVYAYNHGWWWLFQNKYVVSKLQAQKGMEPKRG